MSFRRLPFNFSATNPAERQAELMRRFGVPSEDTMFIDNHNDPFADGFSHSSPRLQHRIPVMTDGHPIKIERERCADNVDSINSESKVRIIPIHVEGRDDVEPQNRHRNLSGGSVPCTKTSGFVNEERNRQQTNSGSFFSRPSSEFHPSHSDSQTECRDLKTELSHSKIKPKVHTVPIFVEGQNHGEKLRQCRSVPIHKEVSEKSPNMGNGPCVSKSATEPSVSNINKSPKPDFETSLKIIEAILEEFKPFEEGVQKFSGTQSDKEYRYLDEMLTRCMLKLDDIETFGNEDVRKSRKTAVKRIQDSVNILESKVQSKQNEKLSSSELPTSDLEGVEVELEPAATVEMTENETADTEMTENETADTEMITEEIESNANNHVIDKDSCTLEKSVNDVEKTNAETNVEDKVPTINKNSSNCVELNLKADSLSKDFVKNDIIENCKISAVDGTNEMTCDGDYAKDCVKMDCADENFICPQASKTSDADVEMKDSSELPLKCNNNGVSLPSEI